MPETCSAEFLWWDGDAEGTRACILSPHELGLHYDGREWFDDDGETVDRTDEPTLI